MIKSAKYISQSIGVRATGIYEGNITCTGRLTFLLRQGKGGFHGAIWAPYVTEMSSIIPPEYFHNELVYNNNSLLSFNNQPTTLYIYETRGVNVYDRDPQPRVDTFHFTSSFMVQFEIVFLIGSALYGGLHCLAWNSLFPSHHEQLLWRISSAIMAGAPILISLLVRTIPCLFDLCGTKKVEFAIWGLVFFTFLAYMASRGYVVVECFIQLTHLSPGLVFEEPTWSVYFPHIG